MAFKAKRKIKCKKCGDIIFSKRSGECVRCKCKAIAIDETEFYCRLIGDPEDREDIKGDE